MQHVLARTYNPDSIIFITFLDFNLNVPIEELKWAIRLHFIIFFN